MPTDDVQSLRDAAAPQPRSEDHFFSRWMEQTLLLCVFLIIGALLWFTHQLSDFDARLDQIERRQTASLDETFENRVVDCRILLALRQAIVPGGPCTEPSVETQVAKADVVVVGSAEDHRTTQRLVCALFGGPRPAACDTLQ